MFQRGLSGMILILHSNHRAQIDLLWPHLIWRDFLANKSKATPFFYLDGPFDLTHCEKYFLEHFQFDRAIQK